MEAICPICKQEKISCERDGQGNIISCWGCMNWDVQVAVAKAHNNGEAFDYSKTEVKYGMLLMKKEDDKNEVNKQSDLGW